MIRVRRALVSVHDKTGLRELARGLRSAGVEIVSTGGTARALAEMDIPVTPVADVTGSPEIFDGRVKTLHPAIHGGILFRRDHAGHASEAEKHGIKPIDLVVVNLYPFERTVARPNVTDEQAVEEIDIGGVALIRAAAKNHAHVCVVTDPEDYASVLGEIAGRGGVSEPMSRQLAARAFERTSDYDLAITSYLSSRESTEELSITGQILQPLRYGENPHQRADAYVIPGESGGVLQAQIIQGKELSYNNIVDLDAAWCVARDLHGAGVAIIKHANPCGAAEARTLVDALELARQCDPVSSFGGVYAFNQRVDRATANALIDDVFVECVIAPGYDDGALSVLAEKKNVRALSGDLPPARRGGRDWKRVIGGFLVQDWDDVQIESSELRCVTRRKPSREESEALEFAWRVMRHAKSNAILFCGPGRTLGIGAGQSSRVDSVDLAVLKAGKHGVSLKGSVVASDAFFPFRDGLDAAARAGATAVIQPGGSIRDGEVIAAADEHDLAMVFTGRRHFRH